MIFAPHAVDFYKTGHHRMMPPGTQYIYSNLTPRSDALARLLPEADHRMVFFGLQRYLKQILCAQWNDTFFARSETEVLSHYRRRIEGAIGTGVADLAGFRALHRLGYLPIRIKALPEGTRVPMRVPVLTIVNTHPDFAWLTNYLETQLLAEVWKPCATASIAYEYRRLLHRAALASTGDAAAVRFQGHDFAMRGMSGTADAAHSGLGHLLCFVGTDTIPAIDAAETFYAAGAEGELVGASVAATEHMVMSLGGEADELETFRRLIRDVHPRGVISIVSDTWDYFRVLQDYAPALRDEILARTPDATGLARVVFRPDSGDPVQIVCGDPDAPEGSPQRKGSMQILWDTFGGTTTTQGYRVLNERVGLIYGDAVTLDRAQGLVEGLMHNGFASTNLVLGIGSHSYQTVMRDSYAMAVKATWAQIDGAPRILAKRPKTDSGTKTSASGLLRVEAIGDSFELHDNQTPEQERQGALRTVYENGQLLIDEDFATLRRRIDATLDRD